MFYTLVNQKIVPCDSKTYLADLINVNKREIARTFVAGNKAIVVTLFTGLNHAFAEQEPLYFETVVHGGVYDSQAFRSSNYEEAEQMHLYIVQKTKEQEALWFTPIAQGKKRRYVRRSQSSLN